MDTCCLILLLQFAQTACLSAEMSLVVGLTEHCDVHQLKGSDVKVTSYPIRLFYSQKVMACRRELVEYDQQQREAVASKVQGNMPGVIVRPKVKEVPSCKAGVSTTSSRKDKEG